MPIRAEVAPYAGSGRTIQVRVLAAGLTATDRALRGADVHP